MSRRQLPGCLRLIVVLWGLSLAAWGAPPPAAVAPVERASDALGPAPGSAAVVQETERLVALARARRLQEAVTWRRLLHYRQGWFGGESQARSPSFFLAKDGAEDPAAELEATLRGLVRPWRPADAREQHPFCRFPARLAWLTRELGIDWARLPTRRCPRWEQFQQLLQPRGVTLVFSAYYLNNPASAFGHTFLRFDKVPVGQPQRQELLDYGVDFSAEVDTGNALLYAFKGMTGMFPGVFKKLPYYYKVREYADYESRDLWQYQLELSQAEVEFLLAHVWELGSTVFAYYYLTENCSYHVLSAVEVVRPSMELVSRLGWPVLPAETVRALRSVPGLIGAVTYRPSNRSQFARRVQRLSAEERAFVVALLEDPATPTPEGLSLERQAAALDAALDLGDQRWAKELVFDAPTEGKRHQQALLSRRARLGVRSPPLEVVIPWGEAPHLSHGPRRAELGSGWSRVDGWHHLATLRVAVHSLDDPAQGYPDGTSLEFFPLRLRYSVGSHRLSLDEAYFVRVSSLSPLSRFEQAWSWRLRLGAERLYDAGCQDCLAGVLGFAAGGTLSALDDALLLYGLVDLGVQGLAPLDGVAGAPVRLGASPTLGWRLRAHRRWVSWLELQAPIYPAQTPRLSGLLHASSRYLVAPELALFLDARWYPGETTATLGSSFYF